MVACKHAIQHMISAGGGSIINTASDAALIAEPSRIAYGTSKGAVITFTKYIATQHGRQGIRCNCICPGLIVNDALADRSEEHTSELQSLMRISYAVFCLKKKKTNYQTSIIYM